MPTPRFDMGMARGGDGRIYAIGGAGTTGELNMVEAYSPATNSWTTVAPLPTKRAGLRATSSLEGFIYAIGGSVGLNQYTRRVDVYSPQQNKWSKVPSTLIAHVDGAVATGRHRIFIISGLTTGGGSTAVVESRRSFCDVCQ
jgi:N-acetylneuraminic acid mutarotase